jgi:hypothetical protein
MLLESWRIAEQRSAGMRYNKCELVDLGIAVNRSVVSGLVVSGKITNG